MSVATEESAGELRERLEQEADAARERLMTRLDRLTERRHRAERWVNALTHEAQQHRGALIGAGAASIGVLALLLVRRRARLRREQQRDVLFRLARLALPILLPRFAGRPEKA